MTSLQTLSRHNYLAGLAIVSASAFCSSASALDLTNFINQATQLSTQASQIQALIPGQNGGNSSPNPQAQQTATQAPMSNTTMARNQESSGSSSMQVIVAFQMQWRADGCFFSQQQEISCQITVVNQGADKKLSQNLSGVSMLDSQGTEYRAHSGGFGKNEAKAQVFANGVASVGVFRFRNVDPNTSAVKRLTFNGSEPIVWSDVPLSRGSATASSGGSGDVFSSARNLLSGGTPATATTVGAGNATTAAAGIPSSSRPAALGSLSPAAPKQTVSLASATDTASPGGSLSTAQHGNAQLAAHDAQRAQRFAARAAMAASSGKAAH